MKLYDSAKSMLLCTLPPSLFRATSIKLKINGRCVNKCSFCKFHNDPSLLEVKDISRFFDMLSGHRYKGIVINGGEPSIHPRFSEICDYLCERFKGKVRLVLGTNLIPLARSSEKYQSLYTKVLATFDHLDVGCDDEHRNINILEQLAPDIIQHGLSMMVNVVTDYCSTQTLERIKVLAQSLGIPITLSQVYSIYNGRSMRNRISEPCRHRFRNFFMDCNGNTFYCYHQEHEKPLFNFFDVRKNEFDYFLRRHDPGIFKFCLFCDLYEPETSLFQKGKFFFHNGRIL